MTDDLEQRLQSLREPADRWARASTKPAAPDVLGPLTRIRLLAVSGAVAVLLLGGFGLAALTRSSEEVRPAPAAPPASEPPPSRVPTGPRPAFVGYEPPAGREGGVATIAARFPDGKAVTLRYAEDLALEEAGVRPGGALSLSVGGEACDALFLSSYGTDAPFHPPGSPLGTYETAAGNASLWASYPDDPAGHYLVFEFGEWRLAIADTSARCVTRPDWAEAWAGNLDADVDAGGFLELRTGSDVRFRDARLTFSTDDFYIDVKELAEGCELRGPAVEDSGDTAVDRSGDSATWCRRGSRVEFNAVAEDAAFLDRLVRTLSSG